ncbi:MAG: hypothetical protein JXB29_12815, partial [Sedimentisphaerales bacterium]|nr:hypothetical protein [Sedimentisphaerales bacterium]
MCRKLLLLISAAFVVVLAGNASAAAEWWVGHVSSDWDDNRNWSYAGGGSWIPTSDTGANMGKSGIPDINFPLVITSSDDLECAGMWAYAGEVNKLQDSSWSMTGGSLACYGAITLGCMGSDANATFTITGGEVNAVGQTLTIGTHFDVFSTGAGVLNMSAPGPTVNVRRIYLSAVPGRGIFNLNAGTINVGDLGLIMSAGGSMDITNGTMTIAGDRMIEIGDYSKAGWITAYGGTVARAYPRAAYDPGTDKTTITAYT